MSTTPTQSLPMYFPSSFTLADAQLCASLVETAYDQFNQWVTQGYPSQSDFTWTPNGPSLTYSQAIWGTVSILHFKFPEPFGFVASDGNGNVYIAFRGTMTRHDTIIDGEVEQTPYALVSGYGNVQVGWYNVYSTISPTLLSILSQLQASTLSTLYFTGHSMGSALSSLAVPDVATNSGITPSATQTLVHYNFASPRVGDPGFAQAMNFQSQVPTFRIVNTEDIVPDVPPPLTGSIIYEHIGTPVDFTAQYLSLDGNHSMANCYCYAINHPTQPQGPVTATANFIVRSEGNTPHAIPLTADK